MFEHLLDLDPSDFVDEGDASAPVLLDAKCNTAQLMLDLGVVSDEAVQTEAEKGAAQRAFLEFTAGNDRGAQQLAVQALSAPMAVRHLVAMLTAYDWQFVEQAQELRGYAVSQILEETRSEDKRHRLRALELLGRVTEVALFTERVEIKKSDVTDAELDEKIKQKLGRVLNADYVKIEEMGLKV